MKKEFCKIILSNGDEISIKELTGLDLWMASVKAVNPQEIPLWLYVFSGHLNGKQITKQYFEELSISDASKIIEAANAQMVNTNFLK